MVNEVLQAKYKQLERIRLLRDLICEIRLPDAPSSLLLSNLEELTSYTKRLHETATKLKEAVKGGVL